MKISPKQYAQALFDSVDNKEEKDLDKVIKKFVDILIQHNQTSNIDRIIAVFERLWDKKYRVVDTEITSVYDLDKNIVNLLRDYVKEVSKANEIEVSTRNDKSILGGVVIRYEDHIFDASLKNKVQALKEKLKS